tara:strand:- start:2620 stop:5253 length:2634 start_codon:yes stop_codon:yes gene_type:complete
VFLSLLFIVGCEDPVNSEEVILEDRNTIYGDQPGNEVADIADYWYDWNENINAHFLYYSEPYYDGSGTSTISSPSTLDPLEDTLNFKTFPDFLINIGTNVDQNATLYQLDESNPSNADWCQNLLIGSVCSDSIDFNNDGVISNGVQESYVIEDTTFSISWQNLDFMEWDSSAGLYTNGESATIQLDSTLSFNVTTDIFDSLVYIGIIDTLYDLSYKALSNGQFMYVDRSEWKKNDTIIYDPSITHELSTTFNYTVKMLGSDSLVFRENSDCDRDGKVDIAEIFYDYGQDFCPDSLESGLGSCSVVNVDPIGSEGYGSFLDEPPCNCLGEWEQINGYWSQKETIINSDWLAATSTTNEVACLELNGFWIDPLNPCCKNSCNYECIYDPNGDNWRDCGLDGYCPDNPLDLLGNEQNTECDGEWNFGEGIEGNGLYDTEEFKGEYFIDVGNGIVDPQEYFYDANNNGQYDFGDSFEDRNCNGVWDDAESEDAGNGIWDDNEKYSLSANGDTLLFVIKESPSNFLVDYSEDYTSSCQSLSIFGKCPKPFEKFAHPDLDSSNTNIISMFSHYLEGEPQFNSYDSLIISNDYSLTQTASYKDVQSKITVYSNTIIDSLLGNPSDYIIAKSQWHEPLMDGVNMLRSYNYDYHIFRNTNDGNIVKMVHPRYFNNYGYFENYTEMESGLWNHKDLIEEVYIFAPGGKIRAQEYYYEDTTIVHELAEYRVEYEFEVEFCDGDGNPDDYCSIDEFGTDEEIIIPAVDTLLQDVFKVIRTRTLTMKGNGLEFGTRNTIWLAKGMGIIKDKLEMRWSEPFWNAESGENWKEFSRLELKELRRSELIRRNLLLNPVKNISLGQIKNQYSFNYDPFELNPIYGLHRLRLRYE